mmetsp:Transcript_147946/g.475010  ORF Transcript_147946/g.475010 Transcript_147946/m.475010 type:complete len:202 (-) Transcript_147946:2-607(-)
MLAMALLSVPNSGGAIGRAGNNHQLRPHHSKYLRDVGTSGSRLGGWRRQGGRRVGLAAQGLRQRKRTSQKAVLENELGPADEACTLSHEVLEVPDALLRAQGRLEQQRAGECEAHPHDERRHRGARCVHRRRLRRHCCGRCLWRRGVYADRGLGGCSCGLCIGRGASLQADPFHGNFHHHLPILRYCTAPNQKTKRRLGIA